MGDRSVCSKIAGVLKELVLSADGVTKIMEIFTSQMDLANSGAETKRKQSDLLMENTHVRLLMDGTGVFLSSLPQNTAMIYTIVVIMVMIIMLICM